MVLIQNSWRDDPVEYLVRAKLPNERSHKASPPIGRGGSNIVGNRKYLELAESYREELRALARSDLLTRAEELAEAEALKVVQRRETEEAQRFFSQPQADTEISHWSRMSAWTLDEAVALSFGKDPRRVNWDNLKSLVNISTFAAKYQAQREIFIRAKLAGQLWDSTFPGIFLAWAERRKVEMPSALVEAVTSLGIQIRDWKTLFDEQKGFADKWAAEALAGKEASLKLMEDHGAFIQKLSNDYQATFEIQQDKIARLEQALQKHAASDADDGTAKAEPKEKSLGTRERNSLLTLVIGMATAWYGYDAAKNRNGTAAEIANELQRVGLSLSDDTIRTYLQEARELLPQPETEQKR